MTTSMRRALTLAVIACAVAAGLALFAASRTWVLDVTVRPAPLPPLTERRPGGSVAPALPALGLVSLAGAGALLATRGRARLVLGVGLLGCGLGIMGTAGFALARVDGVRAGGPVLALAAGATLAVVAIVTVRHGSAWPSLGTRYERRPVNAPPFVPITGAAEMWDAIDRGEDPTNG
jgi:hypothetical protein